MDSIQTDVGQARPRRGNRFGTLKRRWWKGLAVGVVTGLLGAIPALTPLGNDFEKNVGLAWLFKVRGAVVPPPQVAVVAINARASAKLGLPALPRDWPRSIHGKLIDSLVERGAAVIVFDVDFRRPKSAEHDLALADAVARSGRTVLVEALTGKRAPILDVTGRQVGTMWVEQLLSPVKPLAQAAAGLAPFPVPKVQVNVFQYWAFKPSVDDAPTLPVMALQLYLRGTYERWLGVLEEAGARGIEALPRNRGGLTRAADVRGMMRTLRRSFRSDPALGDRVNALLEEQRGQALSDMDYRRLRALVRLFAGADHRYLNFYGPPGTIPTIPYNAVITGNDPNVDPDALDFTDKVVFVGFSDLFDPGQPDRFYTVFTRSDGVDLSGVEIAATAFGNLLADTPVIPADTPVTVATLLLFGLLLGTGIYLLTAWIAVPLAVLVTGLYVAGVQSAFNSVGLWMPLATPVLVQLPLALFVGLMAQYLLERRRQKRFSKAVSYYLPEHAARELTDKELDPSALNRVVYGICFATDMSGFTSISQSLGPSKLAEFMNSYFDALAAALKRHHVDVTEFHADTIMCAWTADRPESLDRRSPTLAALATLAAVEAFNAQHDGVNLNARVGMDEGQFYLGHTGGGGRMGYSILGDCANTAARLESLNKHLKTHILASGPIVADSDHLLLRPVGQYVLVGKSDPLPVFEIVAEASRATEHQRALCERFAEAFETFGRRQWAKATQQFEGILHDFPNDGPTLFHLSRCQEYQAESADVEDPSIVLMSAK